MAKNLGFYFDDQLNMNQQISLVSQMCYLNLRDPKKIGSKLNQELELQLVHSSIMSFIDYCNASYIEDLLKRIFSGFKNFKIIQCVSFFI